MSILFEQLLEALEIEDEEIEEKEDLDESCKEEKEE